MDKRTIMKMDDRELYGAVLDFVLDDPSIPKGPSDMDINNALFRCYQAEEKLKEMGLDSNYTYNLYLDIERGLELYPDNIFNLVHAHPIPRARAILMTIGEG